MEYVLGVIIIVVVASFVDGVFDILMDDMPEYNFIEEYKSDASQFRFIPRLFIMFFIFIIEYSYKFGIKSSLFIKRLFIK